MALSKIDQYEREMERCHCRPEEMVARVFAGEPGEASVWVCGLRFHHDAAVRWVEAITGKPHQVIRKDQR